MFDNLITLNAVDVVAYLGHNPNYSLDKIYLNDLYVSYIYLHWLSSLSSTLIAIIDGMYLEQLIRCYSLSVVYVGSLGNVRDGKTNINNL